MTHYAIRKNFTAYVSNSVKTMRGKLAFKTREIHWLNTEEPVVIPISIHSAIHEELTGDLKINALVSIIRGHVKNRVTILFTEKAHLQVETLRWQNQEEAFEACLKQTKILHERYEPIFANCNVTYWNEYICQDKYYGEAYERVLDLFQRDPVFRTLLYEDSKKQYTPERAKQYPVKDLFIEKSILDIIEQNVSLLILANKGYKFYFYPGPSYISTEYVNQHLVPKSNRIAWIDVFLSIEKKTVVRKTISNAA